MRTLSLAASALVLDTSPAAADECRDRLDLMNGWMASGEYNELSADHEGAALLDAPCEAGAITAWFAGHGWTLASDNPRPPTEAGPPGRLYWSDRGLNYCLPERGFWALLGRDCDWMAHVQMHESRITHMSAAPVK